jgi:tRNA (mo5U34)-methyltransferase
VRTAIPSAEALAFIAAASFRWFQRFRLAEDVYTPITGSDVEWLLRTASLEPDLRGKSVLDVGCNNGGVCFEAERRGATDVVGVDIFPAEFWGFDKLREFLGSSSRFVQGSVYGLTDVLTEPRDVVFCFGVLYHLRHPLMALDMLREVTREYALIESAVADWELGDVPASRFYRGRELNADGSNWFAPTVRCLMEWCSSAGFEPELLAAWPEDAPQRAMVRCIPLPGIPEWERISWDTPLGVKPREHWLK